MKESNVSPRFLAFQAKVIGILQSTGNLPIRVVQDDVLNTVLIYNGDELRLELDRDLFDELTVHEILNKSGVPFDE